MSLAPRRALSGLAALLLLPLSAPGAAEPGYLGTYRAVLTVPGGELPFGLEIKTEAGRPVAYLINGAERVRVPDVTVEGAHIDLFMPAYDRHLVATITDQGLTGEAHVLRRGGVLVTLPFHATRGATWRFFEHPAPAPADLGGRWAVDFKSDDGSHEAAIAELAQSGTHLTGTFLTPSGDHRYLEGEVRGRDLYLSRFDGGSAFLYHAHVEDSGELDGTLWSGSWAKESFHGVRNAKATLTDPGEAAGLSGKARFTFAFPDLNGKPVSLNDARFRGKVLIVSIGGSWCPNCHDEAAFLVPYYRKLKARGLEIVFLQFEYLDDFAAAVAANRRFAGTYGIDWPLLIAGVSDHDDAEKKLPALGHLYGWPTTLFLDRHHEVRRIHTGFSGPATGAHYAEWRQEFESLIHTLLAEKA